MTVFNIQCDSNLWIVYPVELYEWSSMQIYEYFETPDAHERVFDNQADARMYVLLHGTLNKEH